MTPCKTLNYALTAPERRSIWDSYDVYSPGQYALAAKGIPLNILLTGTVFRLDPVRFVRWLTCSD